MQRGDTQHSDMWSHLFILLFHPLLCSGENNHIPLETGILHTPSPSLLNVESISLENFGAQTQRGFHSENVPDVQPTRPSKKIKFNATGRNIVLSEHKDVKFNCSIMVPNVHSEEQITWWKDGKLLPSSDRISVQLFEIPIGDTTSISSSCSIAGVLRADNGTYHCKLRIKEDEIVSEPIYIQVEGLPHFVRQLEGLNVSKNTPFNLTCEAVGPPEPVEIFWFRNSRKVNEIPAVSPAILNVLG